MIPRRLLRIVFAVLLPVSLAAGCKKKAPEPASSMDSSAPSAEVRLQVTSLSPSIVAPNTTSPGTLFGSAFEPGATVEFMGALRSRVLAENVVVDGSSAITLTIPPLPAGEHDVIVTNPNGESSMLRGGLAVRSESCSAVTLHFDFDSSRLRSETRDMLGARISCFQALAGDIRVEGHCDERGTVDYNSVLGQRRAESVKSYLVSNGISASRVKTISYGEERPIDRGHNEAAWAKNRRAEIQALE